MLKMMVGSNLKDEQLQQIVDKTVLIHLSLDTKPHCATLSHRVTESPATLVYPGLQVRTLDKDCDGMVSYEEFCNIVGPSTQAVLAPNSLRENVPTLLYSSPHQEKEWARRMRRM